MKKYIIYTPFSEDQTHYLLKVKRVKKRHGNIFVKKCEILDIKNENKNFDFCKEKGIICLKPKGCAVGLEVLFDPANQIMAKTDEEAKLIFRKM